MASEKGFDTCCFKSFTWDGTPTGQESTLAENHTYITGTNKHSAVLFVHDALGWKFSNARLLADHFAKEANVTVYLPDFFAGEQLDAQKIKEGNFHELDMEGFKTRNSRAIREPEIFACARALRQSGYKKIGAVGYCYGGWAVLSLASTTSPCLLDAVICAHPSLITKGDFDNIQVPIMILAPEHDAMFTDEMKEYAFRKLVLKKKSVGVEWVHFPGVSHGALTKGDEGVSCVVEGWSAADCDVF